MSSIIAGLAIPTVIRKTAKEIAGCHYENIEHQPGWKQLWPSAEKYVDMNWPYFVKPAKDALVTLLGAPEDQITPHMKEEIYNAVIRSPETVYDHLTPASSEAEAVLRDVERRRGDIRR